VTRRCRGFAATSSLLAVAIVLLVGAASASAATLQQRLDYLVRRSSVAGISSVYVWDQESRDVLYSRAPGSARTPASTMKLLTSSAALARFGPDYRFQTRVALEGTQDGDTFTGDVWLVGGGDPSLSTFGFARDNYHGVGANLAMLVAPLRARGITRVVGSIRVDDDLFDQLRWVPEWKRSFRYEESGALGALTVNQSLLGKWVGTKSSRAPDVRAGEVFRDLLHRQGITVSEPTTTGSMPADTEVVGTLPSPPLADLLQHMLRESDNFYAETLLKDIGASRHGENARASTVDGRRAARGELEALGVNLDAVRWLDGSGLAYGNRVTARTLGHVLGMGSQADWGAQWVEAFARSGTYGTLRHRMTRRPYRGRIAAKTGTLNQASGLAGFAARSGSGHRYGFVVLTSSPSGRSISYSAARNLQDRIAMVLVR
jgi:D-alanyl-D-alanine carboxypeptidase/D-alanyl-D-alanine-endopeptidase (penicillin-binding protein 4)